MNREFELALKLSEKIEDAREKLLEDLSTYKEKQAAVEKGLKINEDEAKYAGAQLKMLSVKLGLFSAKEINEVHDFQEIIGLVKEQRSKMDLVKLPENVVSFPTHDVPDEPEIKKYPITIDDHEDSTHAEERNELNLQEAVADVLRTLTVLEQLLLSLRFGIYEHFDSSAFIDGATRSSKKILNKTPGKFYCMTYQWIGDQLKGHHFKGKWLGYSRQTISRRVRKALRKLRHPTRASGLDGYTSGKLENGEERLIYELFGR